ncbi:MAG: DUF4296 domain-containing protein [bacterium]|nr:DUF4296 domain-containing protein [bacterium]
MTSSCGKRGQEDSTIPPGILSPRTMAKLLSDFALAEVSANMNIKNTPIQKIDSVYAFDPLRENHVRTSQYDSTLLFYANHPVLYKEVYDSVLVILSEYKAMRNMSKVDSISK